MKLGRGRPGRVLLALTAGNCFELYDFTLFSFFSVTLSRVFFPDNAPVISLLLVLSTFGAGFVTRPLGSILIGSYADRAGRKPAITLSLALMTVGTAIVALSPSHAQIGVLAPVLLVAGRMLQGLGLGGEIGPTTALLWEIAPPDKRVRYVGLQMASQGTAALLGAVSAIAVHSLASETTIEEGAWRIPFLIGLIVGPIGLYLRATLGASLPRSRVSVDPLTLLVRKYRWPLLAGILIICSGTASTYVVVFYMPTYLIRMVGLPPVSALLASCVAGIVLGVGSMLAGWLSDRVGRKKPFFLASSLGSALLIMPSFQLLDQHITPLLMLTVVALLVACNAFGSAAGLALILEAFPEEVRAGGLSIAYAVGVSIFGGSAQFIVTGLIAATGNPIAPAWYVMACSLAGLVGVSLIRPSQTETRAPVGVDRSAEI